MPVSFPVVHACASDPVLRTLLLAELTSLAIDAWEPIMLPEGSRVQTLPPAEWLMFKTELSGLNANTLPITQA